MPATFEDRFTMPEAAPFTRPGDSVFATEDPDELLGRLWVAGTLDETILPPERKAALAAWKKKLLARTARDIEGSVGVAGAEASEAPASPRDDSAAARKQARNAKGQFAKGNPGGPGNPFGRKVAALRARLLSRATDDDWDTIADALIEKARAGDTAAIKLYYQYTLGKPAQAVDPDRADIDEANLLEAARRCIELAKNLVHTPPLEVFLAIIHIMQEVNEVRVATEIKKGVDNGNRMDALRAQRAAKAAERREKRRAAVTQPHQTAPGADSQPVAPGEPRGVSGEPRGVSPRVTGATLVVDSAPAAPTEAPPCAVESPVPGATTHPAADAARLAESAQPVAPPSTNGRNDRTPGVPPSAPLANGDNGNGQPSTNGRNGAAGPSPNGNKRRPASRGA